MLIPVKVFVALSILWAAIALVAQVVAARGGGRKDYSKRSGNPHKGMVYNFTVAMMPAHKETVKRHPGKFAVGVLMHVGVLLVMVAVVLLLVRPTAGCRVIAFVRPMVALSLLAGVYLFIRRIFSEDLRAMSAPDDYVAILATCGLLELAFLHPVGAQTQTAFLIYAGLLFVYLPLGKLRHAMFFFVARGDHGRRLGYRGVYPPAAPGTE
ncbi:MAG TPA: hypothetical protein VM487_23855 [Phycisphaerae bacterium]|nr:hypothetical protein [Phycisphaerae bacterium]